FTAAKTPWHPTVFSPDSKTLLTLRTANGPGDPTWLHAFDLATGKELPVRGSDGARGNSRGNYIFSPDGRRFGYGDGQQFFVLAADSGKLIQSFAHPQLSMAFPAFAADGKLLALPSGNEGMRVLEVETGKEIASLTEEKQQTRAAAFAPDGKTLAILSWNSTTQNDSLALWDLKTGKVL